MVCNARSVFLAVNVRLRWLNNVSGVYLVQISLILIGQQVWDISSGIGPCFPLAGALCKLYVNAGGKLQIHRQPLLVQYKQQANPPITIYYFSPLVISMNEKISN
jgi:hypothetical protein